MSQLFACLSYYLHNLATIKAKALNLGSFDWKVGFVKLLFCCVNLQRTLHFYSQASFLIRNVLIATPLFSLLPSDSYFQSQLYKRPESYIERLERWLLPLIQYVTGNPPIPIALILHITTSSLDFARFLSSRGSCNAAGQHYGFRL